MDNPTPQNTDNQDPKVPDNHHVNNPGPWTIITEVTRRVPAARFLLVLIGLIAVAALGVGLFFGNWKIALVATLLVFILAVPSILLMSAATVVTQRGLRILIYFMLWAFLLIAISIFVLLITCTVWRKPRDIREILSSGESQPFYISSPIDPDNGAVTNKPYIILSIVDYVDIEPSPTNSDIICDRRISYTLLPLHNWSDNDENTFTEQYSTLYGNAFPPDHWYGTAMEKIWGDLKKPEGRAYDVKFNATEHVPISVVTGCNAIYHETSETRFPPYNWHTPLASNQDFFAYPNTGDYVCDYTILIDSRGFKLTSLAAIAERTGIKQILSPVEVEDGEDTLLKVNKPLGKYCISARWQNLIPGDGTEIVFQWDRLAKNQSQFLKQQE
jgi:hypothetical protein